LLRALRYYGSFSPTRAGFVSISDGDRVYVNNRDDRILSLDPHGCTAAKIGPIAKLNPGGGNFGPDGRYFIGSRTARTIMAFRLVCCGERRWSIAVRWVNGANARRRATRRRASRRRASRVPRPTRARASRHNIRRSTGAATKADSSRPSRSRSRLGSSPGSSRSSLGNRNSRSRDHRNSRRSRDHRNSRCQKRK
jgi:hypothetical protein